MMRMILSDTGSFIARFGRDERGSSTIEFVLFVPFIFTFWLSSFEMGMMMVRQTMLDRGVDLTVRIIRLNQMVDAAGEPVVTRENLRRSICFYSGGLVPQCDDRLRVEMIRSDPHNWAATAGSATADGDCVNVDEPASPATGIFEAGGANELIILRVCALIEPLSLTAGLGATMQRRSGDFYALYTMAAFAVEPDV